MDKGMRGKSERSEGQRETAERQVMRRILTVRRGQGELGEVQLV